MLIIMYVSGTYDYLYIHEIYVNLIWYMHLFLLDKLSESESRYAGRKTVYGWHWLMPKFLQPAPEQWRIIDMYLLHNT